MLAGIAWRQSRAEPSRGAQREVHSNRFSWKRALIFLATPLLSSAGFSSARSLRVRSLRHRRTKASIRNAWKPRGSQSAERSSAPEPFGLCGSDVTRLAGMPSPSHRSIARQNRRLAGERALAIAPSLLAERLSLQTGRAPRHGSSKPRAALPARHFVACARGATQNQARPLHADSRAGRAFNFWKEADHRLSALGSRRRRLAVARHASALRSREDGQI
jgi:hypothetical protein